MTKGKNTTRDGPRQSDVPSTPHSINTLHLGETSWLWTTKEKFRSVAETTFFFFFLLFFIESSTLLS